MHFNYFECITAADCACYLRQNRDITETFLGICRFSDRAGGRIGTCGLVARRDFGAFGSSWEIEWGIY